MSEPLGTLPAVLPAFLVAVLVIAASPGPAVALMIRRASIHGFRRSVPLVLGIEAGLFAWAILAATGLAALIAVSEVAYLVLRVVGACVLLYLGGQALRAAWRARREARLLDVGAPAEPGIDTSSESSVEPLRSPRELSPWRAFVEGLVTNLANPKAAVFMVAFFPQFIPAGADVLPTTLALATIQITVESVLYLSFIAAVGRAGRLLATPRVRAALEAASGTVLLALGVRVALQAAPHPP